MQIPQPDLARSITVTSLRFAEGDPLPDRYTCKGDGLPPELNWVGVPAEARSVALVVSDPDAPRGTFLHWLLTGLPAAGKGLPEGGAPPGAREWPNSGRSARWVPPCPPSGTHRYFFGVYALDSQVVGSTTEQVLQQIARHTIAWGTLHGVVSH